jgi:hypothetical protein
MPSTPEDGAPDRESNRRPTDERWHIIVYFLQAIAAGAAAIVALSHLLT